MQIGGRVRPNLNGLTAELYRRLWSLSCKLSSDVFAGKARSHGNLPGQILFDASSQAASNPS